MFPPVLPEVPARPDNCLATTECQGERLHDRSRRQELPLKKTRADVIEMLNRTAMIKDDHSVIDGIKDRLQFVFLVAQPDFILLPFGDILSRAIQLDHLPGNIYRWFDDG